MSTKRASAEGAANKSSAKGSTTPYKQALIEAGKLRGQSGVKAFDRTTILCTVFDDVDFRAEAGEIDDFKAAAILDEYVEDLCLSFLELRGMLEHFPERDQWAEGKLASMHKQVLEARSQPEAEKQTRKRATVAELEAAQAEALDWKTKYEKVNDELTLANARIIQLERELAQHRPAAKAA